MNNQEPIGSPIPDSTHIHRMGVKSPDGVEQDRWLTDEEFKQETEWIINQIEAGNVNRAVFNDSDGHTHITQFGEKPERG